MPRIGWWEVNLQSPAYRRTNLRAMSILEAQQSIEDGRVRVGEIAGFEAQACGSGPDA